MQVVIAPDSFKESLSAPVAAEAMAVGVRRVHPEAVCVLRPLADGGEGTLDALVAALGATRVPVVTTDPRGRPIEAAVALTPDGLGIVEVAQAIGLGLVAPTQRDPLVADSAGVADLVAAAIAAGATRLLIGLGGTATVDGGAGMLARLGILGVSLDAVPVVVASDVTGPLLGPRGAAAVFGPQKGAGPKQVPVLEARLAKVADALVAAGRPDVRDLPGAGAAGGLGAAFLAHGATVRSGFDVVAEAIGLEEAIAGADLVLTGEGSLDAQTAAGKAPVGVLALGRRHGVDVVAFAGRIPDPAAAAALGFAAAVPISDAVPLADALVGARDLLADAVAGFLSRPA